MTALLNEPLKYKQIYNELHKLIERSPAGEKLASERELAKAFNCNMLTIRKSLQMLAAEGLVEKRPRSGTFIADNSKPKADTSDYSEFLCLMIHGKSDAYAHKLLEALAFEASQHELELKTIWYQTFDDTLLKKMEKLSKSGCSGFIFPWMPSTERNDFVDFIDDLDFNITTIVRDDKHLDKFFDVERKAGFPTINFIKAQIDYFLEIGFKDVAFVGPNEIDHSDLKERITAYISVMSSLNLPIYTKMLDNSVEQVDNLVKCWQDKAGKLAIICFDDMHAARILTSMHKHGLQAPGDFGIMGFNDTEHAQFSDPPLSTIAQDFGCQARRMLEHATSNFKQKIKFDESPSRIKFIIRESCGGKDKISKEFLDKLSAVGIGAEICN